MQIDPRWFQPAAVEEETRAANEALEALLRSAPPITDFEPAELRRAREAGESIWGPIQRLEHAEPRSIPGPTGDLPLRIFRPPEIGGVYLHLHGGGWTLGSEDYQDPRLDALAKAAQVAVVSVGYRLSPEDPYPAAPDDCEAAALWLVEHAHKEFGTEQLAIGGESAGAHLAAATLLRLRDRHGACPFQAANLVYGCYDLTLTPSARRWGDLPLVLSTPIIQWFVDSFVPDPGLRGHPDVSPLYADLSGLPPAHFSVGTRDPLVDDSLFMAARWQAAGSRAELSVYPGGVHGFDAFPIALAERARQRCHGFLARQLNGSAGS